MRLESRAGPAWKLLSLIATRYGSMMEKIHARQSLLQGYRQYDSKSAKIQELQADIRSSEAALAKALHMLLRGVRLELWLIITELASLESLPGYQGRVLKADDPTLEAIQRGDEKLREAMAFYQSHPHSPSQISKLLDLAGRYFEQVKETVGKIEEELTALAKAPTLGAGLG